VASEQLEIIEMKVERVEPAPLRHMALNKESGLYEKTDEPAWTLAPGLHSGQALDGVRPASAHYSDRQSGLRGSRWIVVILNAAGLAIGLLWALTPPCNLSIGNTCFVQGQAPIESFARNLDRRPAPRETRPTDPGRHRCFANPLLGCADTPDYLFGQRVIDCGFAHEGRHNCLVSLCSDIPAGVTASGSTICTAPIVVGNP
jgi:hypothetical protein